MAYEPGVNAVLTLTTCCWGIHSLHLILESAFWLLNELVEKLYNRTGLIPALNKQRFNWVEGY